MFRNPVYSTVFTWTLRVLVGATFAMSGFVKMIDLWGFIFKLEEYLALWHMAQPRTIVMIAAMAVAACEFVFGMLLLSGCYKRVATWILLLMMGVMLPLTAYIWIADPVKDCGCFGEFLVISNGATFLKNILLTAALVYLAIYSPRLKMALFNPEIQWIAGALLTLYIILIGLFGYNVQPMLDFRSFPIGGASLAVDSTAEHNDAGEFDLIYTRNGEQRTFTINSLPDSSWQFVDRIPRKSADSSSVTTSTLAIFNADDEDVTPYEISPEGLQILLVIPEPVRADISFTYTVNEIYEYADSTGIPMIALLGTDAAGLSRWQDIAMAEYPCFSADDTTLKELARTNMAIVLLRDGVPISKTSVASLNPAEMESPSSQEAFLEEFDSHGSRWLTLLNIIFGSSLLLLYLFQGIVIAITRRIGRARETESTKTN